MAILTSIASSPQSFRESKKAAIISLRWVLVLASSALILMNSGKQPTSSHAVVLVLLLSNFVFVMLPSGWFVKPAFDMLLVLTDITLISGSIWVTGQVTSDFFLLYFLVIMIAALSETTKSLLWSAALVAAVYLVMVFQLVGFEAAMKTDVLIRVPFLLMVTIFYGHLSQRVRLERTKKNEYRKRLNMAARLRTLSYRFGKTLNRGQIFDILANTERRLTRARFASVISRSDQQVIAESGDKNFRPEPQQISFLFGEIGPLSATTANVQQGSTARRPSWVEKGGAYLLPFDGTADTDLFLCLVGDFDPETLDYAHLLMMYALLALQNSGQYQALLHEVENRQELVKQLGEALEFKSQFVANVSHEVRTPVNSFIGFGELLVDGGYGALSGEQKHVIERMVQNGRDLLLLINNILDFSKMEAKASQVRAEPGSVERFIDGIAETCVPLIREKPVVIKTEVQRGIPVVITDWTMMRQVALNLVSNAIKFTPRGSVVIAAEFLADGSKLRLQVRDTGIGISRGDFGRIFEPFKQIDNAYTKRYAGTGLGLAITKKQVEMMGGKVEVSSVVGEGTQFTVVIPVGVHVDVAAVIEGMVG